MAPDLRSADATRLLLMVAMLAWGCAPPPLTDQPAPDTASGSDTAPARDTGDTGTGDAEATDADSGDVGPPPSFGRIAAIIRYRCTIPNGGCHGGQGQGAFAIDGGPVATASQVQTALEDTTLDNEQTPLVSPGSAEQSALYQVLIPLEGRLRMPFQRDKLPAAEIRAIRRWIAAGANYD